ncbi:MAG: hypothetical protein AAF081_16470, partial [Actinomycetota bacterium]
MTGITVGRHEGRLVAVKQSDEPERRARLRHEATMLAQLDHPGVVHLVDVDEGPPATVRTLFVGPDTWARATPTGTELTDAVAAVIATVADLHDSGVTHGAIEPAHIVIGDAGRPILCGFGDAAPATPTRLLDDRVALASLVAGLDPVDPALE